MSRQGATRSRPADKTKPTAVAPTPTATHDIVAGRFNENDWNNMLEKDSAEEFCLDIVEELTEKLMSSIYENYIERQILPFTITLARNALTEIIEWQFLNRDVGEKGGELDFTWEQDEEPEPAVTDCWAQGSVPKNYIPPVTPLQEIPEEVAEVLGDVQKSSESTDVLIEDIAEQQEIVSDTEEVVTVCKEENKEVADVAKEQQDSKAKLKFRPYRGKLKPAKVEHMTESLEETEMKQYYSQVDLEPVKPTGSLTMPASCASLLKAQNGRPPGNKEVTFDEMGNIIAVVKLDPEKLPTHKVSVKYHVIDPALDSKLETMKKANSRVKLNRSVKSHEAIPKANLKSKHRIHSSLTPLPPPLKTQANSITSVKSSAENFNPVIEEMELSRGVVVREGGRVKKGPGLYYRKFDMLEEGQKGLKQINLKLQNPELTVNDLLDRVTPILRPLGDTSPLPPIVPHHPPQRAQYTV